MTVTSSGTTGPYLDQQIHVLVDETTRAFVLGVAILNAQAAGRKPAEGAATRDLLDIGMGELARRLGEDRTSEILAAGKRELLLRAGISPEDLKSIDGAKWVREALDARAAKVEKEAAKSSASRSE